MTHEIYDPALIQKLADRLCARAVYMKILWTLTGLSVGAAVGYQATHLGGWHEYSAGDIGLGEMFNYHAGQLAVWQGYAAVGALVVGTLGYAIGTAFAVSFKLRTQTALCQKAIEEHTRRLVESATAGKTGSEGT